MSFTYIILIVDKKLIKILLKCLQKTNLFKGDVDHCNTFAMIFQRKPEACEVLKSLDHATAG